MKTTGNRRSTFAIAMLAISSLTNAAASQESNAAIGYLKSSPDGRSSIMQFSVSNLENVNVPDGGCLRFIFETGGGEFRAQVTERSLNNRSKSAAIKNLSSSLDRRLEVYIVAGDQELCKEMDDSRRAFREMNQDVAIPGDYKVSNTCVFFDLNDIQNVERKDRCDG